MSRTLELIVFIGLSAGLHAGALVVLPKSGGGDTGGETAEVALAAATPDLVRMVDAWEQAPDVIDAVALASAPSSVAAPLVPEAEAAAPLAAAPQTISAQAPTAAAVVESTAPASQNAPQLSDTEMISASRMQDGAVQQAVPELSTPDILNAPSTAVTTVSQQRPAPQEKATTRLRTTPEAAVARPMDAPKMAVPDVSATPDGVALAAAPSPLAAPLVPSDLRQVPQPEAPTVAQPAPPRISQPNQVVEAALPVQETPVQPNAPQMPGLATPEVSQPEIAEPPQRVTPGSLAQMAPSALPQVETAPAAPPPVSELAVEASERPKARPEPQAKAPAKAQPKAPQKTAAAPKPKASAKVKKAPQPTETKKKPKVASKAGGGGKSQKAAAPRKAATPPKKGVSAGQAKKLYSLWGGKVRNHVARRAKGLGGNRTVHVLITLAPNGKLLRAGISKSSGNAATDRNALRAVKSVGRFPRAPKGLTKSSYQYRLPLRLQ